MAPFCAAKGLGVGTAVLWSWTWMAFLTTACLLQFPLLWQPGASCPLWLSEQLPQSSLNILQQVFGLLLLLETPAGTRQKASGIVQRGTVEGTRPGRAQLGSEGASAGRLPFP